MIKPRIVLNTQLKFSGEGRKWRCHDDFYLNGYGTTPLEAYEDWQRKDARRTRLPRTNMWKGRKVGYWNLQDAKAWWRRGCPRIRVYIGNQHLVGYLPEEDMLVLRG